MDPERYYKYEDLGTPEQPAGVKPPAVEPEPADENIPDTVYMLANMSERRPGPVLIVGYGTQLRNAVRAAEQLGVRPLCVTGTEDKLRAFSFGGAAHVECLGPKFDERLFVNEYAVLKAAESCGARTLLWIHRAAPSELLKSEAERNDILLLVPNKIDKTFSAWSGAPASETLPKAEWRKCAHCGLMHDTGQVVQNDWHCPTCGRLYRMNTDERLDITLDAGSFQEMDEKLPETNPLDFPEFDGIIERAKTRSGKDEGVRTGIGTIDGIPVAVGVMESSFMMGSMGHVVGEKITRLIERATADGLPVVIFSASGGARMQEGLASLMQMAKVSAALEAHARAGLLYISVITDPTTGGVTASFATLGDIILAEPRAMMGFAGRRVIQDTIKQTLPEEFQSAEFALEHGLIDAIVERADLKDTLAEILKLHGYGNKNGTGDEADAASRSIADYAVESISSSDGNTEDADSKMPGAIRELLNGLGGIADSLGQAFTEQTSTASMWWALRNRGVADMPGTRIATGAIQLPGSKPDEPNRAWESVQLARNAKRPTSLFYINSMVDNFIELHGDRAFGDDGAIVGGIGRINGRPVTMVAQEKGSDLKARIARNFGCPQPEGYRKAQRLMQQAEKFGRPVVCLVDTQGAFCGQEAEEHGIGNAISESLALMAGLTVPVVTVVLGEGGSGGALALAVANRVAMQENAVYSVLSPEGFASILWKDGSRAPEAAKVMKMSAADALSMGIIEDVIPEGTAPAHENPDQAAAAVWLYISNALDELDGIPPEELRSQRYTRFRAF